MRTNMHTLAGEAAVSPAPLPTTGVGHPAPPVLVGSSCGTEQEQLRLGQFTATREDVAMQHCHMIDKLEWVVRHS